MSLPCFGTFGVGLEHFARGFFTAVPTISRLLTVVLINAICNGAYGLYDNFDKFRSWFQLYFSCRTFAVGYDARMIRKKLRYLTSA